MPHARSGGDALRGPVPTLASYMRVAHMVSVRPTSCLAEVPVAPTVDWPGVCANLCSKLTRQVGGERLATLAFARFPHSSFPTLLYLSLCLRVFCSKKLAWE